MSIACVAGSLDLLHKFLEKNSGGGEVGRGEHRAICCL